MTLLGSERAWRKWLRDSVGMYRNDVRDRVGDAATPPKFPCYAYCTVRSFSYEELQPIYLHADNLKKMQADLLWAAVLIATREAMKS